MHGERSATVRLSYDPGGAFRIELAGPRRPATLALAAAWGGGWLIILLSGIAQILRLGRFDWSLAGGLLMVLAAGLPILLAVHWVAAGQPEVALIGRQTLTLIRRVGVWRRAAVFDLAEIRAFHVVPAARPFVADLHAVRRFWIGGHGPLVFDHGGSRIAWGGALDTTAALALADDVARMLPEEACGQAPAPAVTRRLRWGLRAVTAALIVPALTLPVRLLVTDRAICFCEDPAPPPSNPIDPRASAVPSRLVVLVPIGSYPAAAARAIAEHYRQQWGLRIRVEPGLSGVSQAYDASRGQVNAGVLLAALERRYAGTGRVVIGLTEDDMYIPEFQWSYAFSYRRDSRAAVISSARLDRGCLGLFAAAPDRQLARMRKLVGKNIGLMYFQLPLSSDPRSMLYAHVAGPQALDVMSEYY